MVWITQNAWDSTPYEKALKRRIRALTDDPEISAWWESTGKARVIFYMHHQGKGDNVSVQRADDGLVANVRTNISLLDAENPTDEALASESKRFLRLLLDGVATKVKTPRPRTPLLDD